MSKEQLNQRLRSIEALISMHEVQIDSSKKIIEALKEEREQLLKEDK